LCPSYRARLLPFHATQARAQLPAAREAEAEIDNPDLASESATTSLSPLLGGAGPAYWLDLRHYDAVATRAIVQPLLILQGDRDYQVTVAVYGPSSRIGERHDALSNPWKASLEDLNSRSASWLRE
jgi:hypothetical protein